MRGAAVAAAWAAIATGATAGQARPTDGAARWTVEKIITVPEIKEVAIANDGSHAICVARQADLALNTKLSTLYLVDVKTGAARKIAKGAWMEAARAIPNSRDFSILADIGLGVQLYRLSPGGAMTPVVVNRRTSLVGNTPEAIGLTAAEGSIAYGVLGYGWSPDGKSLWYTRAVPRLDGGQRLFGYAVRGIAAPADAELLVRRLDGSETLIDRRPESPLFATVFTLPGDVVWSSDSLRLYYKVATDESGAKSEYFVRPLADATSQRLEAADPVFDRVGKGPFGGQIKNIGWASGRRLVEEMAGGAVHDYGHADFLVGSGYAPGSWRSPDGGTAIIGIRHVDDDVRSGILTLSRAGMREIRANGTLANCAFTPALTSGICVEQSMTLPPRLVRVDPRTLKVDTLVDLDPDHSGIQPLHVEARRWTNRLGYVATGFVVYPRDYRKDQRYPTILVTHWNDGDERFASQDLQWEYPVQVWAERGYTVVIVDEPYGSQAKELADAYAGWFASFEKTSKGSGPDTGRRLQDLVFLNGVASFESVIDALAGEGLTDKDQVGIAGYSRGSQMVNITMTQSTLFRAASSGDGGLMDPAGYFFNEEDRAMYRQVYGGSPYDPKAAENYARMSPAFRAARVAGPVLQQITHVLTDWKLEFYVGMRDAGKPAELVLYPGENRIARESHLFHIPANRIAAMNENIDWFDFWLRSRKDPAPGKAAQYARWESMRGAAAGSGAAGAR